MSRIIDLCGARLGRLTVKARDMSQTGAQAFWLCACECGGAVTVRSQDLRNGHTTSCGCLHTDVTAGIAARHNTTHGMSGTAIYSTWAGMVERCTNPASKAYPRYGGRGITVCEEWRGSFDRFYADFGHKRPSADHSIDRENNDDGYHIGNVRWALPEQQANNRCSTVLITHDGRTLSISQWARLVGLCRSALTRRIRSGWPLTAALSLPPNPNRRFMASKETS